MNCWTALKVASNTTATCSSFIHLSFHHIRTDIPPLDGEPDFWELTSQVICDVTTKWRQLGVGLRLPLTALDAIDADYPKVADKCHQVFLMWSRRQTLPYTWGTVIRVLQSPAVGEQALAERLKNHLCTASRYLS